ncbi:hypothetical protein H0H87_012471 [Tephrocybe sp. NHM501043]|nr:hypothetical protein H0H87_012471 [Tephrocybe sp. NHM501043]
MNGPFPSSTQAGSAQSYPLPITPSQQPTVVSQLPPVSRAQPSAIPFPSSERPMAPINTGSTPQLRPPLQSNSHSRTSSFFSFRNKSSTPSQSAGHIRSDSMGNGNGIGAGEFGTTSGPVQAPISSTQVQQQPSQSPVRIPSVLKKNSTQPASQVQPQPQPIAPQPIHPEIRSVIQLTTAHARKIYYSGPLVRRLERRTTDEKQREEVWFDVWAQLNGTTLSIWDMAQIQEASKQGKEVPPTYVNTTDAFVQVHGAVTTPETPTVPSKKYFNILALNTAGANILLFSCPDPRSLKSWAAALRLAAWEKSRLEEIYTAHLLRIMLKQPDAPSTLVRGRLEGWVRIRIAGQTDWKRMWMIVSVGAGSGHPEHPPPNAGSIGSTPTPIPTVPRKGRMSSLFSSRDTSVVLPSKPIVSLYASQKPKDKKKALLSFKDVTQAFAVYPERPELISRSTLIKVEGTFGDEEVAGQMRNRQGWLLMMPDLEGSVGQAEEMLKWVIALHDAFELYGRPKPWTWDPRDPVSLMFAYPVGPNRDLLFLDRELAEILDPRDEHTSSIRSRLIGILLDRMRGHDPRPAPSDLPPSLPPIGNNVVAVPQQQTPSAPAPQPVSNVSGSSFQLPPLSFGATTLPDDEKPLSPVRRQSNADAAGNSYNSPVQAPPPQSHYIGQTTSTVTPEANVFDRPVTNSPAPASPPQSISGVESSMQSPQPSISNVTAPGRHSFDTPSLNRGFQVPSSPSRVDSTTSSTSVFSKSENRSYNDGSNPLVSKSPLSSSTEASHATSSTAPLPSHSPPSYTPSTLATSHAEFGAGPPLVTVPKRSISVLTSPHSVFAQDDESSQPSFEIPDHASILTSPHSIAGAHPTLTSPYSPRGTIRSIDGRSSFGPVSRPVSSIGAQPAGIRSEDSGNLLSEAGALYYMQQQQSDDVAAHPRRVPTTINEQSDSDSDDDEESQHAPSRKSSRAGAVSPVSNDSTHSRNRPVRQSTPMAFFDRSSPIPTSTVSAVAPADRQSPSRQGLGRKPSGARAQATTRAYNPVESISSQPVTEEETQSDDHYETPLQARMDQIQTQPSASSEADLDTLAILSYLSVDDKPPSPKQTSVEPLNIQKTPSPGPVAGETPSQFKSSFAPSKQAAERKAKAQAQQAAHQIATHKPGRANGKRKSRVAGAWNESSDEEEEEEDDDDDDDDDADSDAEPSLANKQNSGSGSSTTSLQQRQQQPSEQIGEQQYSHLRPPRSLPQVPANNYRK